MIIILSDFLKKRGKKAGFTGYFQVRRLALVIFQKVIIPIPVKQDQSQVFTLSGSKMGANTNRDYSLFSLSLSIGSPGYLVVCDL